MSRTNNSQSLNFNQDPNVLKRKKINYVQTPCHVFEAKVSYGARILWIFLGQLGGVKRHHVFLVRKRLAEKLDCSVRTIDRYMGELIKAGLIFTTNLWQNGKYRKFQLNWGDMALEAPATTEKSLSNQDFPLKEKPQVPCTEANGDRAKDVGCNTSETSVSLAERHQCLTKYEERELRNKQTGRSAEAKSETVQALLKNGLKKTVVVDLIKSKGEEECKKQLEHLREKQQAGATIKNAAGWLRSAICRGFSTTTDSEKHQQKARGLQKTQKNNAIFEESKKHFDSRNYQKAIEGAESLLAQGRHFPAAELLRNAERALERASVREKSHQKLFAQQKKTSWGDSGQVFEDIFKNSMAV